MVQTRPKNTVLIVCVALFVLCSIEISSSYGNIVTKSDSVSEEIVERKNLIIASDAIINPGFETGSFNPWVNFGATSYNVIQTGTVYSGTYALYMDSHLSTQPFEPVFQNLSAPVGLDSNPTLQAAIKPSKVGNTCGQVGISSIYVTIRNTQLSEETTINYIWSGYTFPGNDYDANITWAAYNIFDWIPNQWNILDRSILADYIAVLGTPADSSVLKITRVTILAHVSNGDPGDFYADDVTVVVPTTTTPTTQQTTTIPTTQTNTIPTSFGIALSAEIAIGLIVSVGLIGGIAIISRNRARNSKLVDERHTKLSEERHNTGIPAITKSELFEESPTIPRMDPKVVALRGAEFVGNKLRYKVKVVNESGYVVTDVTVSILAYPRDSLRLDGDSTKVISKLEPGGFRSPSFEFLPTLDCVRGDVIASVSFIDSEGKPHSITTEAYTIRAVCDLLQSETISPERFLLRLKEMNHGEITSKVDEWSPEEMHSKTLQILESSNFFEVSSEMSQIGGHIESRIVGWAKGKYSGKNVGVEIIITGESGAKGAICRVKMSGEDEAMIMPAIDEIKQKLSAWLCPMCGGALAQESVDRLKAGLSIACPFCGVTIDR